MPKDGGISAREAFMFCNKKTNAAFITAMILAGIVTYAWSADEDTSDTFRVLSITPAPKALLDTPPSSIRIQFNREVDAGLLNTKSVKLMRSGVGGLFDDGNDVEIKPAGIQLTSPTEAILDLTGLVLPPDKYRIVLSGKVESSLEFDGDNDLVILPQRLLTDRRTLTVEVRFRPEGPGVILGMQSQYYADHSSRALPLFYMGLDNRLRAQLWTDTIRPMTNETSYVAGNWTNAALVGDIIKQTLYIDGVPDNSLTGAIDLSNMRFNQIGTGFTRGGWPSASNLWFPFKGDVDEIRIWNVVRSAEEIQQTLNEALTGREPGLVACWTFDENEGQIVRDISPNRLNGTLGTSDQPDSSDPRRFIELHEGVPVLDSSGNRLDGEFSGKLPSGNGIPGGYFVSGFAVRGIGVVAPNGGEVWLWGSAQAIRWVADGLTRVKIEASADGGASWFVVTPATSNDGQYHWETPAILSNQFMIRISDADDPAVSDTSDAFFTIEEGLLAVVAPNGGERWAAGTLHPIRWDIQGIVGPAVRIEASFDDGKNWTFVAAVPSANRVYNWQLPNVRSSYSMVRITDTETPDITDVSDHPFEIFKPTSDARADVNLDGFVDFRDLLILEMDWGTGNETEYGG